MLRWVRYGFVAGSSGDFKICKLKVRIECLGDLWYNQVACLIKKSGICRAKEGISKGYKIALMCSEKDPHECHRIILVSRVLHNDGVEVCHIISKEQTVTQSDIEAELKRKFDLGPSLFESEQEILDQAYNRQESQISYRGGQDHAIVG